MPISCRGDLCADDEQSDIVKDARGRVPDAQV